MFEFVKLANFISESGGANFDLSGLENPYLPLGLPIIGGLAIYGAISGKRKLEAELINKL